MASQVEGIKWVPGTRLMVDGFRFQHPDCRAYFLTHAHSDHTTGLTQSFSAGPIYCSPITARLLRLELGIRQDLLRPLPLDQPTTVCGVEVTALDANHCPGAVMLLFSIPPASGAGAPTTVLHTGDLRWHAGMAEHPALAGQRLDVLMLDTTYCQPRWTFPPQGQAVQQMVELLGREAAAGPAGGVLFVTGSYHIGKERAYLGAAHALGWRVHVAPAKHRLLRMLGLPPEWLALLTEEAEDAQMHVLGMGEQLHPQALAERIAGTRWQRVVAIKPTGWSFRPKGGLDVREEGCVTLVGVPYSEHSSYSELRDCVRALRPRRLVPTVNAGDAAKRRAIVDRFADLMDLSADRSRLDCYLRPRPGPAAAAAASEGVGGEDGVDGQLEDAASGGGGSMADAAAVAASPGGSDGCGRGALSLRSAGRGDELEREAAPGAAPDAAATGQEEVDVSAVDVAQQQRILDAILAANGSKKRQAGGETALRQGTLKRFLASPSQPSPPSQP